MWSEPGYYYTTMGHSLADFCQQIQDVYGRGYSVRDSVWCQEFTSYEGSTRSQLANNQHFKKKRQDCHTAVISDIITQIMKGGPLLRRLSNKQRKQFLFLLDRSTQM